MDETMRMHDENHFEDDQKVFPSWWNVRPALLMLGTSVILSLVALLGITTGISSFSTTHSMDFFSNTMTAWNEPATMKGKDDVVDRDPSQHNGHHPFRLLSKTMNDGGNLPYAYTCMADDGVGTSPPFYWENAPSDTKQFFLMMETDAYKHDGTYLYTRDDWTIYNIPSEVTSIEAGNTGSVGIRGGTFPGIEMHEYNPPCPFGSGNKTYYFTIYAVSEDLGAVVCPVGTHMDTKTNPPTLRCDRDSADEIGINMVSLADSLGMILASASLTTSFCRYSDSLESCTMGNYLRHQAQRPAGPTRGDIFEPQLGGKEQKMIGSSLAKEIYTKSQFHLSTVAQQGQIIDEEDSEEEGEAAIPKNARVKIDKVTDKAQSVIPSSSTNLLPYLQNRKKEQTILTTEHTVEGMDTQGKSKIKSLGKEKDDVRVETKESSKEEKTSKKIGRGGEEEGEGKKASHSTR